MSTRPAIVLSAEAESQIVRLIELHGQKFALDAHSERVFGLSWFKEFIVQNNTTSERTAFGSCYQNSIMRRSKCYPYVDDQRALQLVECRDGKLFAILLEPRFLGAAKLRLDYDQDFSITQLG